jgi:hypothetical protein
MASCGHAHGHADGGVEGEAPSPARPRDSASAGAAAATAAAASLASAVLSRAEGAAGLEDESAVALFLRGEALYHHIVDGVALATCHEHDNAAHTAEALGIFLEVSRRVRAESLISRDDTAEELPTDTLQLLLAEYYIANLRSRDGAVDGRATRLRGARLGLELFLDRVVGYGIVSPAAARLEGIAAILAASGVASLSRSALGDRDGDARGAGGAGGGADVDSAPSRPGGSAAGRLGAAMAATGALTLGVAPADARAAKIARFKRNQDAKARLAVLAGLNGRRIAMSKAGRGRDGGGTGGGIDDALADGIGAFGGRGGGGGGGGGVWGGGPRRAAGGGGGARPPGGAVEFAWDTLTASISILDGGLGAGLPTPGTVIEWA